MNTECLNETEFSYTVYDTEALTFTDLSDIPMSQYMNVISASVSVFPVFIPILHIPMRNIFS